MERGKGKGRISVRRMQMKLLEQGNATMGVWLGKQILGQTDQVVHEVYGHQQYNIVIMPRCEDLVEAERVIPLIEAPTNEPE